MKGTTLQHREQREADSNDQKGLPGKPSAKVNRQGMNGPEQPRS